MARRRLTMQKFHHQKHHSQYIDMAETKIIIILGLNFITVQKKMTS